MVQDVAPSVSIEWAMQAGSSTTITQQEPRQQVVNGELLTTIVLATAEVRIYSAGKLLQPVRALMDSGAQMSLLKRDVAEKLGLTLTKCRHSIYGIAGEDIVKRKARVSLYPWFEAECQIEVEVWIMDEIKGIYPQGRIDLQPVEGVVLADPKFNVPAEVHMLLGAEVWANVIRPKVFYHNDGSVMQATAFGYMILGRCSMPRDVDSQLVMQALNATCPEAEADLCRTLEKFWIIEEVPKLPRQRSSEQEAAENVFLQKHRRNKDGRYVVYIPIKPNGLPIADCRNIALRRFHCLERKLQANPEFREKYVEHMREAESLGHMQEATRNAVAGQTVYIPHHAVLKKFRPVYDASCKNNKGNSLNEIQYIGEKLQFDLQDQLLRFRRHKIAIMADIAKMFRQICIDESQWDLQRIFWRETPYAPLKEYWLTRITYGMASAGHCAVRTMIQCGRDHAEQFPIAARVIETCFYMDDGLFGTPTIAEAKILCREVDFVLKKAGMELRHWKSNSKEVQKAITAEATSEDSVDFAEDDETKVLGLRWLTQSDQLTIYVKGDGMVQMNTKRKILSAIGKIYDPIGCVAPYVMNFKMLMQDIWRSKAIGWDDAIPKGLMKRWQELSIDIDKLEAFRLPRWLSSDTAEQIQLHGFADASSQAYGAVIYVRTIDRHGKINCRFLCAKSRVAPIRTVSIPRLELAAAEMLSRLMLHVVKVCELHNAQLYLRSDSTIVLHWLGKAPFELKVYVANRVAAIQNRTKINLWSHVDTHDNPADLMTRGIRAGELIDSCLWKEGPVWLSQPETTWPKSKLQFTPQLKEQIQAECKPPSDRINIIALTIMAHQRKCTILHRFSAWDKVTRVTAYVLRAVHNMRTKDTRRKLAGKQLSQTELDQAAKFWIKISQAEHYHAEIKCLKGKENLFPPKSKIAGMRPFIDAEGLLRAGGRVGKADVGYERKHPIIIPLRSRLSWLIMHDAHKQTLHGGVQLMMAFLQKAYWIPRIRLELRNMVRNCRNCIRQKGLTSSQIMGDLPLERVKPARPFLHAGVDLAGPFEIKLAERINMSTRSRSVLDQNLKGYVVVFVCLVTRAVHLEAVMAISAEAFLAAYERFIGRRGPCRIMYSDNGTNFVAADRLLREAVESWQKDEVMRRINTPQTVWKFITPSAPHQGGLWEAAVKQMKHHLKRVMGTHRYSYEGISTLLAGIEACMNSRPICAMSDDPDDLAALTPGHFLIGEPLRLPLAEKYDTPPKMAMSLYKNMQIQVNAFWKRWADEYFVSLMARNKWRLEEANLQTGQLVLIKADNVAPTYWALGRIIRTHIGDDGRVRSATIKLAEGELERPIQKLCLLPIDDVLGQYN